MKSSLRNGRGRGFASSPGKSLVMLFSPESGFSVCLLNIFVISCLISSCVVSGQQSGSVRTNPTSGASAAAAVNSGVPSLSSTTSSSGLGGGTSASEDTDYSDADYDDKDVQFDQSPPNVLILLADPENGTTTPLANQPNSEVILDPSLKKIHLFCSAYYPIKWVYSGQGFPFLNVDNTRFTDDFYDPTTYAFSALLELEGLDESQTGNYSCQKWDDDTFISSFYVFIPGERVLLLERNSTIAVERNQTQVTVPCSVSNPAANVTLMKLLPPSSGLVAAEWAPVSPSMYRYHPKSGFTFTGAMARNALGTYECSVPAVGSKVEISLVAKGSPDDTTGEANKNRCCDKTYLRELGDERTSCRGFISKYCQTPEYLESNGKGTCQDWKLSQFLKNRVEPCKDEMDPNGINSHTGVGFFKTDDTPTPQLFMFCQADPKEYTQGFKMAVQWRNGSMLFVDDERHRIPQFSRFPAGYEVNAEITDLLNPSAPTDMIYVHCYIPLKFSFKWIKIVKEIPSEELQVFAPKQNQSGRPTLRPAPPSSAAASEATIEDGDNDDQSEDEHHHHEHDHSNDEQNDENLSSLSSTSKSVELDNHDINENILSERKGEVGPQVEDVDPTVTSGASSNYRLHSQLATSANWHVLLSLGLTLAFSLISL